MVINTYPKIYEFETNKINAMNVAKKNNLKLFPIDIDLNNVNEKEYTAINAF